MIIETPPTDRTAPRLGVNYTPSRGWFHSWLDFDPAAAARDLDAISALGVDHLRVLPLWPILQPDRTMINTRAVADLLALTDLAAERDLDVSVEVLQGHLSSFDFLPAWVGSWHRRNVFTDPDVVAAQARLVDVLGRELAGRPNALGLGLGNEFGQFAAARHPSAYPLDTAGAGAWLDALLGAAGRAWPTGLHQASFDDDVWFADDHPFTPRLAASRGALTVVHAWVFGGVGRRYGADHPALAQFARYLVELARAWSPPGRAVWLQEVGAPRAAHDGRPLVADAEAFLTDTVGALADAPDLWGITWWASHDVSRDLADFPELEYGLGLIDADNRPKPIGRALAEQAPRIRAARPAPAAGPVVELALAEDGSDRSLGGPESDAFDAWLTERLAGRAPRLRLSTH